MAEGRLRDASLQVPVSKTNECQNFISSWVTGCLNHYLIFLSEFQLGLLLPDFPSRCPAVHAVVSIPRPYLTLEIHRLVKACPNSKRLCLKQIALRFAFPTKSLICYSLRIFAIRNSRLQAGDRPSIEPILIHISKQKRRVFDFRRKRTIERIQNAAASEFRDDIWKQCKCTWTVL